MCGDNVQLNLVAIALRRVGHQVTVLEKDRSLHHDQVSKNGNCGKQFMRSRTSDPWGMQDGA
jgi:hypothetical protein